MIKDILNRDLVNLQNCESEPIHIPGSIQPHGFLIGINTTNLTIEFCSGNTPRFIGKSHSQILGIPASKLLGSDQQKAVLDYISEKKLLASPMLISINGSTFTATIHQSGTCCIVECEPASETDNTPARLYEQTSQFLLYMHETHTLQELCQLVADGTRELTGYDRVMIYRFDKDFNGEVFAESCTEEVEPFLGLHYPHTDIPAQARELYMKNLLRLIADVHYEPVPIYTLGEKNNESLDLSLSVLRSSSPIHMQYLQNMGVGATLTISLIHQKRLWGLIACHHYSAKNITPEIRLAAQLQGHFITSQIEVRQMNEEYEVARLTDAALNRLNSAFFAQSRDAFQSIAESQDLLLLCNASAVAISFGNEIYKSEHAPTDLQIGQIGSELSWRTTAYSTNKLADTLPHLDCEEIAGIIFHPLGEGNFIMWFRPETVNEVNWAGDPNKAILKDASGLSPRNSFALWKEVVKCQSNPWQQPELNSAANFAYALQIRMSLILLTEQEKRNHELNEILKETNSELENINWISTHDLQEPLRKIQLNASRLLVKNDNVPENIVQDIMRMSNSALRMQKLLTDILKYTKIQHTESRPAQIDPNPILQEVVDELHEQSHGKSAAIKIFQLPPIMAIPFLLKQLFSNLLNNSMKFSAEGRDLQISVSSPHGLKSYEGGADPEQLYQIIEITDNGIGFEAEFEESIFNIFKRLNGQSEYDGSGVGLALCKKIMKAHNGYISAKGILGSGAVFSLYFPAANASTAS